MSLKLEDKPQVCRFHPVIQETIIPHFLEPVRKHMHQVAADKFHMVQGNDAFGFSGLLSPGSERNLRICYRTKPAVGDGDFMRIPSQILNSIAEAVEGFFYVGAPVYGIQAVFEFLPLIGIAEGITGMGKRKTFFLVQGI